MKKKLETINSDIKFTITEVGSKQEHTNGNKYEVIAIANKPTMHPDKYPNTVVYQGNNGKIWCRKLSDWSRSMKLIQEARKDKHKQ